MSEFTFSTVVLKKIQAVRAELGSFSKDAINPHFKKKYASLSGMLYALAGPMAEQGLAIVHKPLDCEPDRIRLLTSIVDLESGESCDSVLVLPIAKKDPQGVGSAITYARRYSISCLFAMDADDDDGNAASERPNRKPDSKPQGGKKGDYPYMEVGTFKGKIKALKMLSSGGEGNKRYELWKVLSDSGHVAKIFTRGEGPSNRIEELQIAKRTGDTVALKIVEDSSKPGETKIEQVYNPKTAKGTPDAPAEDDYLDGEPQNF